MRIGISSASISNPKNITPSTIVKLHIIRYLSGSGFSSVLNLTLTVGVGLRLLTSLYKNIAYFLIQPRNSPNNSKGSSPSSNLTTRKSFFLHLTVIDGWKNFTRQSFGEPSK